MEPVFLSMKCCVMWKHWVVWSVIHERHTHPISYLALLVGRRTLSSRFPRVGRTLWGVQPNLLLRVGAVGTGCPEPCPACFDYLQGWRCHHHPCGKPVPVLDQDSSFSLCWARIFCVATWVHRLTSLMKSRFDHSFSNPIDFIWTALSSLLQIVVGIELQGTYDQ